jgi:DeoR family suf operon transcriptional repressor
MTTTSQHHSTKDDILQLLRKQGQATAHELAEQLDISPQAIRRHLKDLEAKHLIEHQLIQEGMGRPQHLFRLTEQGRDHFPHRYDEFAVSLLDTLAETVGPEQVSLILQKQWQRKALDYRDRLGKGPLKQRVAALVELRKIEGYMAEWHPVEHEGTKEGDRFLITEHNCAISNVAESFPRVCDHELEMFAVVLPDCVVERTYWMINGEHRCGYMVSSRE